MARSVLGAFVSGTRQMLAVQLLISVSAIGLAGWTLAVTNDLIRERNRLKDRVIQLEEVLAAADIIVPPIADVVDPPRAESAYPPSVALPEQTAPEPSQPAAQEPQGQAQTPTPATPETQQPAQPVDQPAPAAAEPGRRFDPGQILGDLFTPAPPLRTVVLHARSDADARAAQRLAGELMQTSNVRIAVDVLAPRDARESGYAYFDGRQSRAAAALMQQVHNIARRQEIAAWSAQLRGVALPAQGEYTADRLDIVLPPLPSGPSVNPQILQRADPRVLQRQVQPQQQPTIR